MNLIRKTLTALTISAAVLLAPTVTAKVNMDNTVGSIAQQDLPKEAQKTLSLIQSGGPFPYKIKDGSVFGNREGILPRQPRGYYAEYTVKTPGSRDRGARRIVAGKGKTGDWATSGEYFYTEDHYASFKRIVLKP